MSEKILSGIVVSNKMQKTIVVKVERTVMHPIYKKFFSVHKKYSVHDEESKAGVGDVVSIASSRPLSKTKRWKLLEVTDVAKKLGDLA